MIVYRIVKDWARAGDLSGTGAFRYGGRWNNSGTYMLYTSENSSLAYLESLAHFGDDIPPKLYIVKLEINDKGDIIFKLPAKGYPLNWMESESLECKSLGDEMMSDQKYVCIQVRSKVNPYEYNYLLNPTYPGYHMLVNIISVEELNIDGRLI